MESSLDQFKTLIWIIVTVYRVAASDRCQFPDFLQSNGTLDRVERKWMSHVVNDEGTGSSFCALPVNFDGGNWHQMSPLENCRNHDIDQVAFKRECILTVQRNRFVVRHYDVKINVDFNTTTTYRRDLLFKGYLCIEFVRRGPTVAQIRTTEKYRWLADSSVCNDDVVLDEWPLVDFGEAFFGTPSLCRLAIGRVNPGGGGGGGFKVRLNDKSLQRGLCDALDGETRVEFACSSDDVGIDDSDNLIEFRFRHPICLPRGFGMAINQRVSCLASWIDDSSGNGTAQQSFAVLRHDVDKRVWCLRLPTSRSWTGTGPQQQSTSFTGHLFRDVRCDRAGLTDLNTDRYLRIDFIPDEPIYDSRLEQRVSSPEMTADENDIDDVGVERRNTAAEAVIDGRLLCRDDYEVCELWKSQPCRESVSADRLACPRRCRVCSDEMPTSCSMPHELRGHWKKDGRATLIIGRHTVQFARRNSTITLSCVDWDPPPRTNNSTSFSSSTSYERMFVRLFSNGCRPRYACAQFRRPSPNVLLVRVSRFLTWPFVTEADRPVRCSDYFSFKDDPGLDGIYDYQLFVSAVPRPTCDMQLVASVIADGVNVEDLSVDFSGAPKCKGRLQINRDDNELVRASQHPVTDVGETTGYDGRYSIYAKDKFGGSDVAQSTTFKLVLFDYPERGGESEQSYRCIASTGCNLDSRRSSLETDVCILTETGDDGAVLCWWFPVNSYTTLTTGQVVERFFLLPGVACYTSLRNALVLANFTRVVPIPITASTRYLKTTTEVQLSVVNIGSIRILDPLIVMMIAVVNVLVSMCSGCCCCYYLVA